MIHCTGGRSYTFKMQSEAVCEKLVANILELILTRTGRAVEQ